MPKEPNTVFIVMGVSGCGKSTLGVLLADCLDIPFFDGDDYHPEANVTKMREGEALTDADRLPWLRRLNTLAQENTAPGCVIACSALKKKYRELLSTGIERNVVWIFMEGDFETILDRLQKRKGHFMPTALLTSQFEALEPPADAINIPVALLPEEQLDMAINSWKTKNKSGQ